MPVRAVTVILALGTGAIGWVLGQRRNKTARKASQKASSTP